MFLPPWWSALTSFDCITLLPFSYFLSELVGAFYFDSARSARPVHFQDTDVLAVHFMSVSKGLEFKPSFGCCLLYYVELKTV